MPRSIRESPMLNTPKNPSVFRRILRNRSGLVGLLLVSFYLAVGLVGLLGWTPYPPHETHTPDRLKAPSETYIMCTDLL